MSKATDFRIYYHPDEKGSGCIVQMINGDASQGLQMQRHRTFCGKGRLGFASSILRDPAYLDIDKWTAAHGLSPMELCPHIWLEQGIAKFEPYLVDQEPANSDNEVQRSFEIWIYNRTVKEDSVRIEGQVSDRVHGMYSDSQRRSVESIREEIYKKTLLATTTWQTPTGPASHEIRRQEIACVYRGVQVALECCQVNAVKFNRPIDDFRDTLFTREKFLWERALSASLSEWDSIVEVIDTPVRITDFFEEFRVEKWDELSPARQELFRLALLHAAAEWI